MASGGGSSGSAAGGGSASGGAGSASIFYPTNSATIIGFAPILRAIVRAIEASPVDHIASGGSGRVYLVSYEGQQYIIKKIFSTISIKIFENEIAALERLHKNPNAVKLFASGTTANGRYLMFPYIPGQTLDAWIESISQKEELPIVLKEQMFNKLNSALKTIHEAGVVHDDIKGSNIWIPSNEAMSPFFIDFGVARILGGEASRPNYADEGVETGKNKDIKELTNAVFAIPLVQLPAAAGGGGGGAAAAAPIHVMSYGAALTTIQQAARAPNPKGSIGYFIPHSVAEIARKADAMRAGTESRSDGAVNIIEVVEYADDEEEMDARRRVGRDLSLSGGGARSRKRINRTKRTKRATTKRAKTQKRKRTRSRSRSSHHQK